MVMMIYTIVIEFSPGHWASNKSEDEFSSGWLIRLAEADSDAGQSFALYDRDQMIHVLTREEKDLLLGMLGDIVVKAPWNAHAGLDGTTVTLVIRAPMSEIHFSWWSEAPKEWESVGRIVDYALSLWKKYRG